METQKNPDESFDDVVFENRNKEYGAYQLRRSYSKDMFIATIAALSVFILFVFSTVILANYNKKDRNLTTQVTGDFFTVKPDDNVKPPEPPKLPEEKLPEAKAIFKIPVIVDSTDKPVDMGTMDDLVNKVQNDSMSGNGELMVVKPPDIPIDNQEPEGFLPFEEAPEFPGGAEALVKFILDNIEYPDIPKKENVQGKVGIEFIINEKGEVTNAKVVRSVDPYLDAEALRVINSMPLWTPGKMGGRPVKVKMGLPIKFVLNN
jgi:protein TonB